MTTTQAAASDRMPPEGRRALIGAWFGFYVDMFDIYLPILALAPAMIYFIPDSMPAGAAAIVASLLFAATLVGRPLGAFIFGHVADTVGRKRATIIAVAGFGAMSVVLAALPGYQQWGVAAAVVFIVVRFVDGVFVGGEYTGASPLALEYSPRHKRGFNGAFIMSGYPLAYCSLALITFGLLQVIPAGALNSPYVQWGWRIPFLIGAVLAFAFVGWYARYVNESVVWKEAPKTKAPLLALFRGQNLRNFLQIFLVMTGVWFALNMVSAVLPGLLSDSVGLGDSQVQVVLIIAYAVLVAGYIGAGLLSQRIGRRPFFLLAGGATAVLGPLVYGLIVAGVASTFAGTVMLVIVLNLIAVSMWGVVTTYINERFHVGVRASGYGIGYSLAIIIPSFYAIYQTGLANIMPMEYTALVILAIAGLLIAGGAALGPETRDVDMAEAAPAAPADRPTAEVSGHEEARTGSPGTD